jgi:hypothetical protein
MGDPRGSVVEKAEMMTRERMGVAGDEGFESASSSL